MSLADADDVVLALQADPLNEGSRYVAAHPEDGLNGTEEISGLLYSYLERDQLEPRQIRLYVYLGVGPVAGALWEQDMRVLERISGLEHPALPRIVGGGHLEAEAPGRGPTPIARGAAFIRVAMGVDVSDGTGIAMYLAEQPDRITLGLQYFWQLADALAVLHDSGVVHRNLWPGTLITYRDREDSAEYRVQLARFEMSVLLANLLRSSRADSALREAVQRFYRTQDSRSRVYAAPERLDFVFGTSPHNIATDKGDVFALGVMAAEWLLGPDVLPDTFASKAEVIEAHRRLRIEIARSPLPLAVQSLLAEMLHEKDSERLTAYQVTGALARHFTDSATIGGQEATAPYLVLFMPGQNATDKTLKEWEYITEPSDSQEGRAQVIQLIERDMTLSAVFHSPSGAADYVKVGDLADRAAATTVIVGKELLWFVHRYWLRPGMGSRIVFDHAVVIKYVLERARHPHVVKQLQAFALPRRVFKVEAVSTRDADYGWLTSQQGLRPSWRSMTEAPVIRGRTLQPQLTAHLNAMDWYLEYQGAALDARVYAYVLNRRSPTTATLVWDREAEHERLSRLSGLRHKVVSDPYRPGPAQHVSDQSGETAKGVWLNIRSRDENRWPSARYQVLEVRGAEEVVVDISGRRHIPDRGWLRLEDDRASIPALRRQGEARLELERNPALLRQLVEPSGRSNDAWVGMLPEIPLQGEGRDAVLDVLQNQTMFALQGPPGTGKTEVTSEAVRQYLLRNREARILVSAQSHDALDNLGERILRKLEMLGGASANTTWLALRVAGTMAQESLSATMRDFLEEKVAARLVASSRRQSRDWLVQSRVEGIAPIVGAWRELARDAEIDLRLRIRRGANLVFATTGASTRENLVTYGSPEPFDWVVVEEAARAWPTELALPLVRGTRWTLVGDQAQIGPYSRTDIERFLDGCVDDPDEEVEAMAESRDAYGKAFETFGSMFAPLPAGTTSAPPPTRTLSQQYRMAPAISDVISTAFYKESGGLQAMRDDCRPPVDHPEWLEGQSLVWIDTDPWERAENFWENLDEADVVAALVERLRPQLERQSQTLAVLSPYRRQCEALAGRIDRSLVHTIDGFQGREAHVVIASLVRDKIIKDRTEIAMVGHLAHAPRANVLLSRARELLVVVGRLPLYESHAGKHWAEVVKAFRSDQGRVVPVKSTGLLAQRSGGR